MTPFDSYYARLAEAAERGPQVYGGNAAIASLRAFKRYHPDARVEFLDYGGVLHWVSAKQARVQAILSRHAVAGTPTKVRLIADEALVAPSTVSRAILKLQAWGVFAVDVTRGRNGGIRVWQVVGDRWALYAANARAKLRAMAQKAAERVRAAAHAVNVASIARLRSEKEIEDLKQEYEATRQRTKELLATEDATFRRVRAWIETPGHFAAFRSKVFAERRRLAAVDPEGESEAVMPLDTWRAVGSKVMADIERYATSEGDE